MINATPREEGALLLPTRRQRLLQLFEHQRSVGPPVPRIASTMSGASSARRRILLSAGTSASSKAAGLSAAAAVVATIN